MSARGKIYTTREIKTMGGDVQISTKTKPKYAHVVLVLDTIEAASDYPVDAAVDSLNNMGWVKFDDVMKVHGKEKAMEVVEYVNKKNTRALAALEKKKVLDGNSKSKSKR